MTFVACRGFLSNLTLSDSNPFNFNLNPLEDYDEDAADAEDDDYVPENGGYWFKGIQVLIPSL